MVQLLTNVIWSENPFVTLFSQTSAEKVSTFREANIGVVCLQHTQTRIFRLYETCMYFCEQKKIVSHIENLCV